MGLDIFVWKEELETRDEEQHVTVVKRTDVFQAKGWAIGNFLMETFDLNNGQTATIDLEDACEGIETEAQTLSRNDADAINEGYEDAIKELYAVLRQALLWRNTDGNPYGEYSWSLSW